MAEAFLWLIIFTMPVLAWFYIKKALDFGKQSDLRMVYLLDERFQKIFKETMESSHG